MFAGRPCVHGIRGVNVWCACNACVSCVLGVREWHAGPRGGRGGRGMRVCFNFIFYFKLASNFKSARTTNAMQTRTHAMHATSARTHIHTRVKNSSSRTLCTLREYRDYGYLKIERIKNTLNVLSWLKIKKIKNIQRVFQEYAFDFKI